MALSDGPLIVGYKTIPGDMSTTPGVICQLQTGGPAIVHEETTPSHRIGFIDGHYWSADGKVYLVGSEYDSMPQLGNGKIWTWDGTSLVVDHTFPAAVLKDNFFVSCITEFGGSLYVGVHNIVAGSPTGGRVYRQTSPGAGWVEVFSFLAGTIEGPVYLEEVQGQLFVCLDTRNVAGPFSFAYSPTGDPGSWVLGPWIGAASYGPRSIFWDGAQWVYTCVLQSGPFGSVNVFVAPALGGPWVGPTAYPGTQETGQTFTDGTDWYITMNNQASTFKWDGANWSTWRAEPGALGASPSSGANDGALYDGSVYLPLLFPGNSYYGKDLDPPVLLPTPAVFIPNSFVPTPTAPPTWDVLDVEPADWSGAPFCDSSVEGTVVYGADSMTVRGDLGLDTPSRYTLLFGGCRPALPADWDMQIELEFVRLPNLHNLKGERVLVIGVGAVGDRVVGLSISQQGLAYLSGYEENDTNTYGGKLPGSGLYVEEGDSVVLKLTGLGSDPQGRSYMSIQTPQGLYRRGFRSFGPPGGPSSDYMLIEAVGKAGDPIEVKVKGWHIRTHAFDPTDTNSMDNTKPQAATT